MPSAEPPDDDGWTEDADPESVARTILLDQLSRQARSRKELAERLARRNVPDDVAGPLLDRFEEVGLVDDEAFARAWVDSRQRTRGLARPALAVELRRKGIADETARAVLAEVDPGDEEAAARRLVRKKLRSMRGLEEQVAARRLVGMLARKGYPSGMAFAVVKDELRMVDDDSGSTDLA
ncbi:regulatory protein RecX [Nocardioides sp. SYSU DS0651]|uniref:regulatory protein RecX n=1 Tax=Nocardioides sp. SYSU DS0651 TaxID=3415955 RepID=UPI003F4C7CE3